MGYFSICILFFINIQVCNLKNSNAINETIHYTITSLLPNCMDNENKLFMDVKIHERLQVELL